MIFDPYFIITSALLGGLLANVATCHYFRRRYRRVEQETWAAARKFYTLKNREQ